MALIAPWLRPPDVLEAMRSGASLGLQLRAQNIAQAEAAARREQEAAELEARQQTAADALRVQRETGAARLAMAASAAAALAGHRGEQRKLDEAAQALRVRAEDRLEKHQRFLEEQALKKVAPQAPTDIVTRRDPVSGRLMQWRGDRWIPIDAAPRAPGTEPLEKAEQKAQEKAYGEAAAVLREEGRKGKTDSKANVQATKDFQSASNALLRLSPREIPTLKSGELPKPATKAEYDKLPSGTRYIDPNGKERVKS